MDNKLCKNVNYCVYTVGVQEMGNRPFGRPIGKPIFSQILEWGTFFVAEGGENKEKLNGKTESSRRKNKVVFNLT